MGFTHSTQMTFQWQRGEADGRSGFPMSGSDFELSPYLPFVCTLIVMPLETG